MNNLFKDLVRWTLPNLTRKNLAWSGENLSRILSDGFLPRHLVSIMLHHARSPTIMQGIYSRACTQIAIVSSVQLNIWQNTRTWHHGTWRWHSIIRNSQNVKKLSTCANTRYKALFSDLSNGPGVEANWYPEEQCMLVESDYVLHHLCTGILYSVDHAIYYVDLRNTKQPLHMLKGHSKAVSGIQFISPNEIVTS